METIMDGTVPAPPNDESEEVSVSFDDLPSSSSPRITSPNSSSSSSPEERRGPREDGRRGPREKKRRCDNSSSAQQPATAASAVAGPTNDKGGHRGGAGDERRMIRTRQRQQQQQEELVRSATEYERAIRRALRDNGTLRSNNAALLTELRSKEDDMMQLKAVCADMMTLVTELQYQQQPSQQQQQSQRQRQRDISNTSHEGEEGGEGDTENNEVEELRQVLASAKLQLERVRQERDMAREELSLQRSSSLTTTATTTNNDNNNTSSTTSTREYNTILKERDNLLSENNTLRYQIEVAMAEAVNENELLKRRIEEITTTSSSSSVVVHVVASVVDGGGKEDEETRIIDDNRDATIIPPIAAPEAAATTTTSPPLTREERDDYVTQIENLHQLVQTLGSSAREKVDGANSKVMTVLAERDDLLAENIALRKQIEAAMAEAVLENDVLKQRVQSLQEEKKVVWDGGGGATTAESSSSSSREWGGGNAFMETKLQWVTDTITNLTTERDDYATQVTTLQGNMKQLTADKESDLRTFACRMEAAKELIKVKLTTELTNQLSIRDGIETELRNEQDRLTQSLAIVTDERDNLLVQVEELQCNMDNCQTMVEELRLQLAQRIDSSELDGLATQLEESQRGNNESRALIKELVATNKELSAVSARVETAEHTAQVLVAQSEELQVQNNSLRKQVECVMAESITLKQQLDILQCGSESESGIAIFESEVQLMKEREGHCEIRRQMECEHAELTAKNVELSTRIDELEKEVNVANQRCSDTTFELNKVTSTSRRLSSHIDALGVEVNQLKQEKETILHSMDILNSDHITAMKGVMDEKWNEINALEEKMNVIVDQSLRAMDMQLRKALSDKKDMTKLLTEAEDRVAILTKQVGQNNMAYEEAREALDRQLSVKKEIEVKLKRERDKLVESVTILGMQLHAKEVIEVELLNEREKLNASIASLSKLLQGKVLIEAELKREQERLTVSVSTLEEDREKLVKRIERLQSDIEIKVAELQTSQSRIDTAESLVTSLSVQLEECKMSNGEMALELQNSKEVACEEQIRLNDMIVAMDAKLLHSDNQLRSLTNSHANAVARFEVIKNGLVNQKQLLQQTNEMDERLQVMSTEVATANSELEDTKRLAHEESIRLNRNIATLESELLESRGQSDSLRVNLHEVTMKAQELLNEKETLRMEISALMCYSPPSVDGGNQSLLTAEFDQSPYNSGLNSIPTVQVEQIIYRDVDQDFLECLYGAPVFASLVEEVNQDTSMISHASEESASLVNGNAPSGRRNGRDDEDDSDNILIMEESNKAIRNKLCAVLAVPNSTFGGELTAVVESLQRESADLRKTIIEKTTTIIHLKTHLQEVCATNELLSSEVSLANGKYTSLTTELSDANKVAITEQAKLASLETDLHRSRQVEGFLESEITSLKSSHADMVERLESDLTALKCNHAVELERLESETMTLKSNYVEKISSLEKTHAVELERLECELTSLKSNHAEEVTFYAAELDRLESFLLSLKSNHAEKIASLKNTHAVELERQECESMSLKSNHAEVLTYHAVELELLKSELTSLECNHAEILVRLENDKKCVINDMTEQIERLNHDKIGLLDQIKGMTHQIERGTREIEDVHAQLNDTKRLAGEETERTILTQAASLHESLQSTESLRRELDAVRTSFNDAELQRQLLLAKNETMQKSVDSSEFEAGWLEEQLSSKILTLEADLLNAKQEEKRFRDILNSLEVSHADEMKRLENDKVDLQFRFDSLTESSLSEQELQESKILSLEEDLLQAKRAEDRLEDNVKLLERNQVELIEKFTAEQELQRSKIIALEEELSKAKNDRDRLGGIVKSLEHKHSEMLARISDDKIDHQHQLHASSSKIQSLETDLLQAVKEVERLEKATKLLECNNAEAVAKLDELDDDNQDLKHQLIELTETSAAEQERLRVELLILHERLDAAKSEIDDLQRQLITSIETSAAEHQALRDKIVALELVINERSVEIQSLIWKVDDAEARFKLSELENKALTEERDVRLVDHCNEIAKLTKRVEDELSERDNLQKLFVDEKLQNELLSRRSVGAETERDAATIRISELSEQLKSTSLTLTNVQQLIVSDEKQISELQNTIRSLEKERHEANHRTESITSERDSNSRHLEFSRKEADEFRCKLDSSEALVATLTNQNEKAQAKLQSMEDEHDKLTRCISQLSAKRKEESERLLQRCKRQQEASQCEIACLENIIASLKKEYEAFKVEKTATTTAQTRSFEAKLQSIPLLEKEISHLRGELETNTKNLHAALEEGLLLEEARNERAILEQQVRILSSEVMKYKLQNRGMLQALDDLTIGMINAGNDVYK